MPDIIENVEIPANAEKLETNKTENTAPVIPPPEEKKTIPPAFEFIPPADIPINIPPIPEQFNIPGVPPGNVGSEIPPDPNNTGENQKRGRGRPPGSKSKTGAPQLIEAETSDAEFEGLADMSFQMSTGLFANLFGPEWLAKSPEEKKMVVDALARYYKTKGMKDIPPGWGLVLAVSAYSFGRLTQPNTQDKLKLLVAWTRNKVGGIIKMFRRN